MHALNFRVVPRTDTETILSCVRFLIEALLDGSASYATKPEGKNEEGYRWLIRYPDLRHDIKGGNRYIVRGSLLMSKVYSVTN